METDVPCVSALVPLAPGDLLPLVQLPFGR
jgi:hypothetical protein